jgi:hypothetical protein
MARDIAPLTNALDETTPGNQTDVYTLLAAWDKSLRTALERSDGSRFREVMKQYRPQVLEIVDSAATDDDIDWAFLEDCVEAYPAGVGDHYCSSILANVVARCVIRTRITDGVKAIPAWALEYLRSITIDDDGDWAIGAAGAYGWGVGHPDVAVIDWIVERAETEDEWAILDYLQQMGFADPDAAITLLKRLLRSPDVREDIEYLEVLSDSLGQDFSTFPKHWDPHTELDYSATFTEDQRERLLKILGDTVPPDRLRQFDPNLQFDLQRAADEYGPDASE